MSNPKPDVGVQRTSLTTAISNDRSHSTNDGKLATAHLNKRNGCPTTYTEKTTVIEDGGESIGGASSKPTYDHTHRKLKPRHIQLIGIGGTIGTALYVQVGKSLMKGGPGSLFLAFSIW
jgi:amino acid transporter